MNRSALKIAFCASTGGHLAQLVRLADEFDAAPESLWITFDSAQSRSLLAGRRALFVPYVRPRDWRGVISTARSIWRHSRGERFDLAISTGAGMALGVFAVLALHRTKLLYIESVSRVNGPSLTGRIMAWSRVVGLRTQHPGWAQGRWRYHSSVLDAFATEPRERAAVLNTMFVTLGTIRPYRFDTAVDAVLATGLANERTTWQLGVTARSDVPGTVQDIVPADVFERLARESDVVVTHAGVGTLLQLLELGVCPVVLVRRAVRNEHVDDHQEQIARLLGGRGLAVVCETDELTAEHIRRAAATRVVSASSDPAANATARK